MDIVPESREASDVIELVSRIYLLEAPIWRTEYDKAEDGYKYLAGEQYTPGRREWYNIQRRPARVFNLVFPIFNQVMGDFIMNDQKVRIYPRANGDPKIATSFEDLIDHYNFQYDVKTSLSRVGLSGLVKMGVGYPRWSDEYEMAGGLVIEDVDEFEVMFDSRAYKDGAEDAMYWLRSRMLTKAQIMAYWPNHREKIKQSLVDRNEEGWYGEMGEFMRLNISHPDFINEIEGKYRTIEFTQIKWERREVAWDRVTNDMQVFSLEGKKADFYLKTHPQIELIQKNAKVKKRFTVLPAMNFLLDSEYVDIQDGKPDYILFNAYNYGKRTIKNFGIFQNAKDPQDDFNEWRNLLADLMNKSTNPGHTYIPALMENPQDVEMYGRQTGINFKLRQQAATYGIEKVIRRNDVPEVPFGPDQMSQEAAEFLMKVTGVTPNFMGSSETRQEPASLFAQRVRQAKIALVVIHNNWQRFKRRLYERSIRILQENLTYERYFAITNPKTLKQKDLIVNQRIGDMIINDLTQGTYGVIAEDLESNPGAKNLRFLQKSEVVQVVVTMFGGAIVNPGAISAVLEWWLMDSDLGDIDEFIAAFAQALGVGDQQMKDAQDKAEAFAVANQMLDLAKKKIDLNQPSAGAEQPPKGGSRNPRESKQIG